MTESAVQASFNAGEWSPNLYSRVDIQKYRSAAALLKNFFVDYRGGASTRPGTKYVIQTFSSYDSTLNVRLLPFQASTYVGYIIEVSDFYMRFIYKGSPVTQAPINITGATQANPCVLTIPGNNFVHNDWIFVTGVAGMTQLNGRYFTVLAINGNLITIGDLNYNNIDSTTYGAYTFGGTAARVYKIASPYKSSDDLRLIKFAQSVNQMILCHPNYPTYILTLVSANNWTLAQASFGATVAPPVGVAVNTTLGAGTWNYAYAVTSIDSSGQESSQSVAGTLSNVLSLRAVAGSNTITWSAVPGAVAYNIYEATITSGAPIPAGANYGFIGTCKGTTFIDSNIAPDFALTPPDAQNPFIGAGIDHVNVTTSGTYTTVPTVSFSGGSSIPAQGLVQLQVQGVPTIGSGGAGGYAVNDTVVFAAGLIVKITAVSGGIPTAWSVVNPGAVTSGSTPANPLNQFSSSGSGTGVRATATWGVGAIIITTAGAGYLSAPAVVFSSGAAAATAVLQSASGNPTVPGFVQQRLFLASLVNSPATFYGSQPGQYFNFNTNTPVVPDDAIQGTLVSGVLNTIKSIVGTFAGMIIFTDKASWIVNGGSNGSAITPSAIVANPQSFVGANDVPPIIANYDILFVQGKGSAVRDLAFNIYFGTFTGTDISIMASHLFYGFTIQEWTWAEQPYYLAQAIRSDGTMLCLTFLKEQEFVGWTHYTTQGLFRSVASVTELLSDGTSVDVVYTVVYRTINGRNVRYIERFAERSFSAGVSNAWCVDAGLQYSGAPATTFTGAEHLAAATVTGLADGSIITPFTMPASGIFTLATPASVVTIGLSYTCQLQTLPLDLGEPTVQGKVKKISSVDIRVKDALGLSIGSGFTTLISMKDLIIGNVSSTLAGQPVQIVSGLVTGDAMTFLDPTYTVPGQFCIQQSNPYPATILGVFPRFVTEDRR